MLRQLIDATQWDIIKLAKEDRTRQPNAVVKTMAMEGAFFTNIFIERKMLAELPAAQHLGYLDCARQHRAAAQSRPDPPRRDASTVIGRHGAEAIAPAGQNLYVAPATERSSASALYEPAPLLPTSTEPASFAFCAPRMLRHIT